MDIPEVFDVNPFFTECKIIKKQTMDFILSKHILFDNDVYQVMGSYSLAGVCDKDMEFEPGDCDVFVRATSNDDFETKVKSRLDTIIPDVSLGFYYDLYYVCPWLYEANFYFFNKYFCRMQFVMIDATRYTHVQVCNMFDFTCCMFRTVRGKYGELKTFANNTYVKELTLRYKQTDVYDTTNDRIIKYTKTRKFEPNNIIPYRKLPHMGTVCRYVGHGIYDFIEMRRNMYIPWIVIKFITLMKVKLCRIRKKIDNQFKNLKIQC